VKEHVPLVFVIFMDYVGFWYFMFFMDWCLTPFKGQTLSDLSGMDLGMTF